MKALSVVVLTLAAALVSAAPVFAGGTAEQPKRGAGLKIALVVKNKDDAYQGIQQGSLAAAKDLGNVDVIFQGRQRRPLQPRPRSSTNLSRRRSTRLSCHRARWARQ